MCCQRVVHAAAAGCATASPWQLVAVMWQGVGAALLQWGASPSTASPPHPFLFTVLWRRKVCGLVAAPHWQLRPRGQRPPSAAGHITPAPRLMMAVPQAHQRRTYPLHPCTLCPFPCSFCPCMQYLVHTADCNLGDTLLMSNRQQIALIPRGMRTSTAHNRSSSRRFLQYLSHPVVLLFA